MTPSQKQRVEEIRDKLKYFRPTRNNLEVSNSEVGFLFEIIDQLTAENVDLRGQVGFLKGRDEVLTEHVTKLTAENEELRDLGSVVVAENKYEAMATFRKRHERANIWKIYDPDPYSPSTEAIYRFMWLPTSQAKRIEEIANGPPSIEALREIECMANEELNQREDGGN